MRYIVVKDIMATVIVEDCRDKIKLLEIKLLDEESTTVFSNSQ